MSETITLDVHATEFELQRAISVYIPLLEACYDLAKARCVCQVVGIVRCCFISGRFGG